ncbi:MAG TPA: Lrp/AsnC family transcriptional regulator [Usitatibacter sp.]|nr:Lrp/AsnC family transcriptional regulator [Usitatibacter sp.]
MRDKDQRLIDLLKLDARAPVAELARKLGVARTTVQERLRRLEESGAIAGYTVRLGQAAGRAAITAHVLLEVNPKRADTVIRELKALVPIRGLYALSGSFDYLAIIETASTHEMDGILDRIGRLEGVAKTESSIVLSVKFERG